MPVDQSLLIAASVLFDAVYIPGGAAAIAILKDLPDATAFIREAYLHAKPVAADGEGVQLVEAALTGLTMSGDKGLILQKDPKTGVAEIFIKAIAQHRFWEREKPVKKL
jgi:catalase